MINAKIYSVCENQGYDTEECIFCGNIEDETGEYTEEYINWLIENNAKKYRIFLSIEALDEDSINQLTHFDGLLNTLYGKNSEYEKRTKKSIITADWYDDRVDYFLPYDIDLLITVLEIFTYKEDTNAYLGDTLITRELLSRMNRRELYCFLSEFIKKDVLELKEKKEKPISLEQLLKSLLQNLN